VRRIHRTVFLHKQIAQPGYGQVVHHINGNTLDNRRSNLQVMRPFEHRWIHTMERISHFPPGPVQEAAAFLARQRARTPCNPAQKTGGTPQTYIPSV